MSDPTLSWLLFSTGLATFGILAAAAQIPVMMKWKTALADLPTLHRQLYLTYGSYTFMTIAFLALVPTFQSDTLAAGGPLARWFTGFATVFWGGRLVLTRILTIDEYLNSWWRKLGYAALTALFVYVFAVMLYATVRG